MLEKPHKFIKEVVESPKFRAGAFTKKAEKAGMTTKAFMKHVLDNPESHNLRTRREAQFMKNIQPKK
jgi:hypothetical protein